MTKPSKCLPEYVQQARVACERMGATDQDLAYLFGVCRRTIAIWKVNNKDFAEAVRVGKEPADAKVEYSLYQRAVGYSHPETIVKVVDKEVVEISTMKHYPPDTAACVFWLRNRKSDKWRQNTEGQSGGGDLSEAVTKLIDKLPN